MKEEKDGPGKSRKGKGSGVSFLTKALYWLPIKVLSPFIFVL